MEAKAKTIQERFGFSDPELTTPKHDEIMICLDENVARLVEEGGCGKLELEGWPGKRETVSYYRKSAQDVYERASRNGVMPAWDGLGPVPNPPPARLRKKTWEYAVGSGQPPRVFTVGFIDMVVDYKKPKLTIKNIEWSHRDDKIVRILDGCLPEWDVSTYYFPNYDDKPLAFEVKPTIRSLGEVIRQIRMYEQHLQAKYFIVSPDDRFAKMLNDQGIGFIQSPR